MFSDERIRQIAKDAAATEDWYNYPVDAIDHGIRRALAEAAQVPVMGEAVAEAYVYEDVDGDDILGLRLLKEDYPMQHGEKLYIEPTTSIPHAELDAKDARIAELEERTSVSLTVGGGHIVYGSGDAILRAQMYLLLDSKHPIEAKDTARYFATALQKANAELDALRKDAERYRWLRDSASSSGTGMSDAEIDAAIAKEQS